MTKKSTYNNALIYSYKLNNDKGISKSQIKDKKSVYKSSTFKREKSPVHTEQTLKGTYRNSTFTSLSKINSKRNLLNSRRNKLKLSKSGEKINLASSINNLNNQLYSSYNNFNSKNIIQLDNFDENNGTSANIRTLNTIYTDGMFSFQNSINRVKDQENSVKSDKSIKNEGLDNEIKAKEVKVKTRNTGSFNTFGNVMSHHTIEEKKNDKKEIGSIVLLEDSCYNFGGSIDKQISQENIEKNNIKDCTKEEEMLIIINDLKESNISLSEKIMHYEKIIDDLTHKNIFYSKSLSEIEEIIRSCSTYKYTTKLTETNQSKDDIIFEQVNQIKNDIKSIISLGELSIQTTEVSF